MSEQKIIHEAIYDLGIDGVEPRRQSPITAGVITLAGLIIFILSFIGPIGSNPNLKSGFALCGILVLAAGIIKLCSVYAGKGKPYYKPAGGFMRKYEVTAEAAQKENIRRLLTEGKLSQLGKIPPGEASAVKAVIYRSPDDELAVAQMLEYVPHAYRPATGIIILKKGDFS
ncbi:MAG: hypothetical protein LUE10_02410 [Alistipes sp.]|nr:hypothetical protein [Alistipes sp.]